MPRTGGSTARNTTDANSASISSKKPGTTKCICRSFARPEKSRTGRECRECRKTRDPCEHDEVIDLKERNRISAFQRFLRYSRHSRHSRHSRPFQPLKHLPHRVDARDISLDIVIAAALARNQPKAAAREGLSRSRSA